jgi:hypothetical protein
MPISARHTIASEQACEPIPVLVPVLVAILPSLDEGSYNIQEFSRKAMSSTTFPFTLLCQQYL